MKKLLKNKYVIIFASLFLFLGVGYGLLSTNLNIFGNTKIDKTTWLVYFDNIIEKDDHFTAINKATITNENKTKIDFSLELDDVGDEYTFTVDTVNDGTIDAMIESVEKTQLENYNEYLDFDVTYDYGGEIKKCDALYSKTNEASENNKKNIKVTIKYKKELESDEDKTIDLSFAINYVQLNDSCDIIKEHKLIIDANGGTYKGEEKKTYFIREKEDYTLDTPRKDGYDFAGWLIVAGEETEELSKNVIQLEKDIYLKATWEKSNKIACQIIEEYNGIDEKIIASYEKVQDCVDNVKDSKHTILLTKDISETVTNQNSFILNLNKYTLKGTFTNAKNANITVINGIINSSEDTTFINYGTLNLGINDEKKEDESVAIIGTELALEQKGTFNYYDGYLEGKIALDGSYNDTPKYRNIVGEQEKELYYYPFLTMNKTTDKQRMYLEGTARAIAKSITKLNQEIYYNNLEDAIDSSSENKTTVYVIRDVTADYSVNVSKETTATIDLVTYDIRIGSDFVNEGTLNIITSGTDNKKIIAENGIVNKGTLNVTRTNIMNRNENNDKYTDIDTITNSGTITLKDSKIYATNGYALKNDSTGVFELDENTLIHANKYSLYNESSNEITLATGKIDNLKNAGKLLINGNINLGKDKEFDSNKYTMVENSGEIKFENYVIGNTDGNNFTIINHGKSILNKVTNLYDGNQYFNIQNGGTLEIDDSDLRSKGNNLTNSGNTTIKNSIIISDTTNEIENRGNLRVESSSIGNALHSINSSSGTIDIINGDIGFTNLSGGKCNIFDGNIQRMRIENSELNIFGGNIIESIATTEKEENEDDDENSAQIKTNSYKTLEDAINAKYSTINISGGNIVGSFANSINATLSNINVTGGTIKNDVGDAIKMIGSNINVNDGIIEGCTNAIYADDDANIIVNNGTITSTEGTAIYMSANKVIEYSNNQSRIITQTTSVINGTITGAIYGIYNKGTVNIGEIDKDEPLDVPVIKGEMYGIYSARGIETINFYDGNIIGKTAGHSGMIVSVPTGKIVGTKLNDGYTIDYLTAKEDFLQVGDKTFNSLDEICNQYDELLETGGYANPDDYAVDKDEVLVKVIKDIDVNYSQSVSKNKKIILDINDHKLSITQPIINDGELTVKNNQKDNTSGLFSLASDGIINNNKLYINNLYIEKKSAGNAIANYGILEINDSKMTTDNEGISVNNRSKATIEDSDFTSSRISINNASNISNLNIRNSNISGGTAISGVGRISIYNCNISSLTALDSYDREKLNEIAEEDSKQQTIIDSSTINGSIYVEYRINSAELSIKNCNITTKKTAIELAGTLKTNIQNSEINVLESIYTKIGATEGYGIRLSGSYLELHDSYVKSESGSGIYNYGGTTKINNSEVLGYLGVKNNNGSTYILSGSTVVGAKYGAENMNSSLFIGEEGNVNDNIEVSGGTASFYNYSGDSKGYVFYYGGTLIGEERYHIGAIKEVSYGYTIEETNTVHNNITYNVEQLIPQDNFLKVGDDEFNSLYNATVAAYNNAKKGIDTPIIMTKDVYLNYSMGTKRTSLNDDTVVTLDLNGHTFNVNDTIYIQNKMKITDNSVEQSGVFVCSDGRLFVVDTDAQLELGTGLYYSENPGYISLNPLEIAPAIINTGKMIVDGANLDTSFTAIKNQGELEIKSGTISSSNLPGIKNLGKLVVSGGEIISGQNIDVNPSYVESIAIDSLRGTVIITGGKLYGKTSGLRFKNTTSTIYDANISSEKYGINLEESSYVTMENGMVSSNEYAVMIKNANSFRITGGDIYGSSIGIYNTGHLKIGNNDGTISKTPKITGGEIGVLLVGSRAEFYDGVIKGKMASYTGSQTSLSLHTRDFDAIESNSIPFDDEEKNNNETYKVSYLVIDEDRIENKTTGVLYKTLDKALNEAKDNDELALISDLPIYNTCEVVNSHNATLDLNGHYIVTNETIDLNMNLEIIDSSNNKSEIKTIKGVQIINSKRNLTLRNIKITNKNSSHIAIENSGTLNIFDVDFITKYGLKNNGSATLNINGLDSTYPEAITIIDNRGKLNVEDLNVTSKSFGIYSNSVWDVNISNSYINSSNGVYAYGEAGTVEITNSNITKNISAVGSLTCNIDNVTTSSISNEANTFVKNSNIYFNSSTGYSIISGAITNKGTIDIKDCKIEVNKDAGNGDNTTAIYNSGTLNIKSTTIDVGNEANTSANYFGIYANKNSSITIDNEENLDEIAQNDLAPSNGFIKINGGSTSYGILLDDPKATVTMLHGSISLINSRESYGVLINNGTFTLGEKESLESDKRGTSEANVSRTNPYILSSGTAKGYGVKRYDGKFNYYDGKIVATTSSKPELAADIEYAYEATTYLTNNGFEKTWLEFMADDYLGKTTCQIGTVYYETVKLAFEAAKDGDTIKLLKNSVEEKITNDKNVILDLNEHKLTASIKNNSDLTIINGSLSYYNGETITNNGTLTLGINNDQLDFVYPLIVSDNEAIINNGTLNYYDGKVLGQTTITNNKIAKIPDNTRTYQEEEVISATLGKESSRVQTLTLEELTLENAQNKLVNLIVSINPNDGYYNNSKDIITSYQKYGDEIILNNPEKQGCDFVGWEIENYGFIIDGKYIKKDFQDDNHGVIKVSDDGTISLVVGASDIIIKAKWKISEGTEAKIKNEFYQTIEEALANVNNNETIELLKDVEKDINIQSGINAIIDLNEHTIIGNITNDGTISIINGKITSTNTGITNNGTITIDKLKVICDDIGIINNGSLTLGNNDGNVSNDDIYVYGKNTGIVQNKIFNFYDGTIQGSVGLLGGASSVPNGKFPYVESTEEGQEQLVYLVGQSAMFSAAIFDNGTTYYFNIQDAIDTAALTNSEVFIIRDVSASYPLTIPENTNIKLNINGKKLNLGNAFTSYGQLTLKDSSDVKGSLTLNTQIDIYDNISVEGINITSTADYALYIHSGTFTMDEASVVKSNKYALYNDSANLEFSCKGKLYGIDNAQPLIINGSTIYGNNDGYAIYNRSNIIMQKGTISSPSTAIINATENSSFILNGGTINATGTGIYNSASKSIITINGGNIQTNGTAINNGGFGTITTVNAGTITSSGADGIFNGNGEWSEASRTYLYINGGEIIGYNNGVYNYVYANMIMEDGLIKNTRQENSGSYAALRNYCTASEIIVNSGKIYSPYSYGVYNEGSTLITNDITIEAMGDAITNYGATLVVNDGTYTHLQEDGYAGIYANRSNITINGGTITKFGSAINMYNDGYYETYSLNVNGGYLNGTSYGIYSSRYNWNRYINIKVTDGEIYGGVYGIIIDADSSINLDVIPKDEDTNITITGGTYGVYQGGATFNLSSIGSTKISGLIYGIYQNNGTLNLGANDDTVSTTNPEIKGVMYGLYQNSGEINFYDGILKGQTAGYYGSFKSFPNGYEVTNSKEDIIEEEITSEYQKSYLTKMTNFLSIDDEEFNSLQNAIDYIDQLESKSGTIKVIDTKTIGETPTIKEGLDITLDLNGNSITLSNIFTNNGKLTIDDTTESKTGMLSNQKTTLITNNGELTINNGNLTSVGYGIYNTGFGAITTVNAGTITSTGADGIFNGNDEWSEASRTYLYINGGEITGYNNGVYNYVYANMIMEDGLIKNTRQENSTSYAALRNYCTASEIIVNSGKIYSPYSYGVYNESSTLTINDVTIEAMGDAIVNYSSTLVVNDGTYTHLQEGGYTGIYANKTNVTFNNGKIEKFDSAINMYNDGYYETYSLNVNGGDLSGTSYGIYSSRYNWNRYINIKVTDGTIYGGNSGIKTDADSSINLDVIPKDEDTNITITGGTYGVFQGGETFNLGSTGTTTIEGGTSGIHQNTGTLNINSSGQTTITGGTYGLYQNAGTLNLGTNDDTVSTTNPQIKGGTYGLYQNSGEINYYDGIFKGQTAGYYGSFKALPESYEVVNNTENIIEAGTNKEYITSSLTKMPDFLSVGDEKFNSLQKAIDYIDQLESKSGTIKVIATKITGETPTITKGLDIILDLNGNSITLSNIFTNNGKLTIDDTTESKTGMLSNQKTTLITNNGELTINNGNLTSVGYGIYNTGFGAITTVNAGTITSTGADGIFNGNDEWSEASRTYLYINGGEITGYNNGVYNYVYANMIMEDGLIKNTRQENSTSYAALRNYCTASEIIVNSGKIYSPYSYGVYNESSTLTINDVTVEAMGDAIVNYSSTLVVNDGTYTHLQEGGYTGIYANKTNVTFNNGKIEKFDSAINMYNDGYYETYLLNVNGGYLNGTSYGIYSSRYNWNRYINIKVTDGEIYGGNSGIKTDADSSINLDVIPKDEDTNITITGGTYGVFQGGETFNLGSTGTTTIEGGTSGIHQNTGTLNINSSGQTTITGGTYGLYQNAGTLNLGTNDDTVSTTNPEIKGGTYGIYQNSGETDFYDGIIKGQTAAFNKSYSNYASRIDSTTEKKISYMATQDTETIYSGTDDTVGTLYYTNYLIEQTPIAYNTKDESLKYTNLQAAFDDAEDGDTIKLIDNIQLYYEVTIPDIEVTLDLNGYDIEYTTTIPITNNGKLKVINTSEDVEKSTITKKSSGNVFINNKELTVDNFIINNTVSDSWLFINNTNCTLTINNMYTKSLAGINNTGKVTIKDSEMYTTSTYVLYDNSTNSTIEANIIIDNSTLSSNDWVFYQNNVDRVDITNSTIKGHMRVQNSNGVLNVNDSTLTSGEHQYNGKITIDNCEVDGLNYIYNGAIVLIDNSNFFYERTWDGDWYTINNNGTLTLSNSTVTGKRSYNSTSYSAGAIYNSNTLTSTNNKYNMSDTYNNGTIYGMVTNNKLTTENDSITISSGRNVYGLHINSSLNYNLKDLSVDIIGTDNAYGFDLTNPTITFDKVDAKITALNNAYGINTSNSTIEVNDAKIIARAKTAYGIYEQSGSIILGENDSEGTASSDVSITNPYIAGIGSINGIGIKKLSGTFKYYDGRIEGSTSTLPEIPNEIQTNYEMFLYYDNTEQAEYCILQYLSGSSLVAEINGTYYSSLYTALKDAKDGDVIELKGYTTESVTVNKNVTINLNDNQLTGQIINNATLKINNGTIISEDLTIKNNGSLEIDSVDITGQVINYSLLKISNTNITNNNGDTIINDGSLYIGTNDGTINNDIGITSSDTAIVNAGRVYYYDGFITGKKIIDGSGIKIPNNCGMTYTELENGIIYAILETSTESSNLDGVDWDFDYTGDEQTFIAPVSGYYQLETWGAQGGYTYSTDKQGGYGSYSSGAVYLEKDEVLYINVGGQGENGTSADVNHISLGGYNGGGNGLNNPTSSGRYASGGGGATHIATSSGLLSSLSESKESILIVSGGGSGYWFYPSSHYTQVVGHGGGYIGNDAIGYGGGTLYYSSGGTQSGSGTQGAVKGTFGQGASGSTSEIPGAGGGYYGGNGNAFGSAGGSGYIANEKLISYGNISKTMYCYNCISSNEIDTKTVKTDIASSTAISKSAKLGNGYAKITMLGKDDSYVNEGELYSGREYEYSYTGNYQIFVAPASGYYQLETWGAQGGGTAIQTEGSHAGLGGYSTGAVYLLRGEPVYIYVGGEGKYGSYQAGGFNGGGSNGNDSGSGGGATHMALSKGLLSSLKDNQNNILIVSGGGGGPDDHFENETTGIENDGSGGSAGGYIGSPAYVNGVKSNRTLYNASGNNDGGCGMGGTQTKGYAFGKGESVTYGTDTGGAGGGYYGGYVTNHNNGGGAGGSSYIGSSKLLSYGNVTKKMYCYDCLESTDSNTYTVSTPNYSSQAKSNYAKSGNGYAKIKIISIDEEQVNYISYENEFDYTGGEQVYSIYEPGYYKLETWGAQGGSHDSNLRGGYGAYSVGVVYISEPTTLYINVGGQGSSGNPGARLNGGYNGGGNGYGYSNRYGASGGGATHIATTSGVLSSLSETKESVLIVSSGGGGAFCYCANGAGADGGGIIGSKSSWSNSCHSYYGQPTGGTQTEGGNIGYSYTNMGTILSGSFGKGGDWNGANLSEGSGGGAGWYGGGAAQFAPGASGSSYIGSNSLISYGDITKAMYCYNCEESSDNDTKTISVSSVSDEAIANNAKSGNGYAKITYLKEEINPNNIYSYDYTGVEQTFTAPTTGIYKLETWGAQGGTVSHNDIEYNGGYGAYSIGYIELNQDDILYINVGGSGITNNGGTIASGGYNGGGNSGKNDSYSSTSPQGSGGGATHIATTSGLLSSLSENVDKILIASGGGGGANFWNGSKSGTNIDQYGFGGNAGGIVGNDGTTNSGHTIGTGGNQSNGGTGYSNGSFGKGANASTSTPGGGGGGAGYYGGGSSYDNAGGGGGSSYIGNSLLSNKSTYCIDCTESNEDETKTISVSNVSTKALSYYAKSGNGYAKITYLENASSDNIYSYDYTGAEQTFTAPTTGIYKLEVWGAQGGNSKPNTEYNGGYGAYSVGYLSLDKNDNLYINVGGEGSKFTGGYNGGGERKNDDNDWDYGGSGGGATHISKVSGKLNSLKENKSQVLIVAAGGGGTGGSSSNNLYYLGGSGGGIVGSSDESNASTGGSQTGPGINANSNTTAAFGLGAASVNEGSGGSGWFGGGSGAHSQTGYAGSGGSSYIGNSLLTNKAMYCYNCTESNEESTKTISTTNTSNTPTSKYAKIGNGYAKITYLGNNNYSYDYTGAEQTFTAPTTGIYKLEAWGAQGGAHNETSEGGYGAYSVGNIALNANDILYINVGGKGNESDGSTGGTGGYNGGGNGGNANSSHINGGGGGGGATHIANISGLLSNITNPSKSLIIVAAGGGGLGNQSTIGHAGGYISNNTSSDNSGCGSNVSAEGATQSSGYLIGQGQSGRNSNGAGNCNSGEGAGGAGSGYYGGNAITYNGANTAVSGTGGSSYIGNSLLTNKAMYCYNCTESNEESTKTISTTNSSITPTTKYAKIGNGYVKITLIGD